MARNHVYTVEYRMNQFSADVRKIDVLASSKEEAYDKAVYEEIMEIEPYSPYSAWVASVTYNNGNTKRFNTFEGNPYWIYRSGRQADDLWKYIPERISDAVDDTLVDPDGYWIFLKEGWTAYDGGEDCRTIHCYSIKDLREDIATIRKEK